MCFRRHLLNLFILGVVLSSLFLSCAQQTAPTGGPRDTIPPVLISTRPAPEATNFNGEQIELYFSEHIIITNPKEQILVIPDHPYTITSRKTKATIELEPPLKDSTTYSLNFRDAIADITEKNPVRNLKYVFSTGPFIDSLSISGTVYNVQSNEPFEDATVALYENDTFNIFSHRPQYITKSDEKGRYDITNLKPGTYYVYAFRDDNKNLIVESKSEAFGFITDSLNLQNDVNNIDIYLQRVDSRPLFMINTRPYNTYFNVRFSKPIATYSLTAEQPTYSIIPDDDNTTIKLYNSWGKIDSVSLRVIATDSLYNTLDTVIYAKFLKPPPRKESFKIAFSDLRVLQPTGQLQATITFNKPVRAILYDSITYEIDSTQTITFQPEDFVTDTIQHQILVRKQIEPARLKTPKTPTSPRKPPTAPQPDSIPPQPTYTWKWNFGKGAFISIEDDSSAVFTQQSTPITLEESATLILSSNIGTPNPIIFQTLAQSKIVSQKKAVEKVVFEYLEPDTYTARVIIDRDKNGTWTPGNFLKKIPIERIYYYKSPKNDKKITLKANWELGPLLITDH